MDNDESDMYLGVAAVLIIISCCILYSRKASEEKNMKDKGYYVNHDKLPDWYKNVLENEERRKKEGEDI